jgi:hypothetical protein
MPLLLKGASCVAHWGLWAFSSTTLADESDTWQLEITGADADLHFTGPARRHVYLTSITKRLDSDRQACDRSGHG